MIYKGLSIIFALIAFITMIFGVLTFLCSGFDKVLPLVIMFIISMAIHVFLKEKYFNLVIKSISEVENID